MIAPHFLVPVDFSAYSDQALAYAIALATKLQARVTVLHVIHHLPMGVSDMPSSLLYPALYLQALEAEGRRRLDAQRAQIQDAGLAGEVMMMHGVPFQTIVDMARDQHVDLIVMGTRGRITPSLTGLHHMLVGSVAEKVVRLAPCPVLVTRTASSTPVP